VTAVQTQNALLDESPAAAGTFESIKIFIPLGFFTLSFKGESSARMALYPQRK
jgi:hypothetical protein